jgi:hypothetical protein
MMPQLRSAGKWLAGQIRPSRQGNRVKKLCGDEACEEVVIPGGDFAAESEGILSYSGISSAA